MILAAGLGERMQPVSGRCAKPALPVLDEPLVARMLRQLAEQGIESAVLNLHAHPESVREAAGGAAIPVEFSSEPELLGSGGGIRAARTRLEPGGRFLVLNGDMWLDLDLRAFLEAHERAGAVATLALRDDPRKRRFGTIGYNGGGSVCRITDLVSKFIVDGFQIVDVYHNDRARSFLLGGPIEFALEMLVEEPPVLELREIVAARDLFKLGVALIPEMSHLLAFSMNREVSARD